MPSIDRILPGLKTFRTYKKEWLPKDLAAGISVAALALPVGIAYSGMVGFPPEVGLYATVFPMALYTLFGTSKQLIIGVDSATCMLIASALLPFASAGMEEFTKMSVTLCFLVGIFCILEGLFRLGFLVDFLSKPILTGFLNGLTFVMIASQLGKLFGVKVIGSNFFDTVADFFKKISETHLPTFVVGISAHIVLLLFKKISRKIPAPMVVAIAGIAVIAIFGLDQSGVGHLSGRN